MAEINKQSAPVSSSQQQQKDQKRYQLVWRAGFNENDKRIVVGSANAASAANQLTKPAPAFFKSKNHQPIHEPNYPQAVDYVQKYLEIANTHDIVIPFNTKICIAQEYSPQVQNKVAQYSTLGGNSVVAFGQGIRKISMKILIVKLEPYWVPWAAALEALTVVSGQPSRYLGGLFLHGYDRSNTVKSRKYKVVIESLTPIHRADRTTTIDYEMNFIVTYDYSSERYGKWGKL